MRGERGAHQAGGLVVPPERMLHADSFSRLIATVRAAKAFDGSSFASRSNCASASR